jgi:hypothetical protein
MEEQTNILSPAPLSVGFAPRLLAMVALALLVAPGIADAQHPHHGHSPYAGQVDQPIKSLSQDDIAELRGGSGWGLAKAAELNGVPGPAHLLELKEKIPLKSSQVEAIGALYKTMRTQAIAEGEKLIALEQRLEERFRTAAITEDMLRELLGEIAASQQRLRYIHLSTHLKTPRLLTKAQIARYNALRGYGSPQPCSQAPPAGHSLEMWRKHNGCD